MFTTFSRILKAGFISFKRNGWLSGATIGIMVLTLSMASGLLFLNVIADSLLQNLEDKIDISVYFDLNAEESKILGLKEELSGFREIKNIEYISEGEALRRFKEKHKENTLLMQSVEELSASPLQASINIKAQESTQYSQIASWLQQDRFKNFINKINFRENEALIAKLSGIIGNVKQSGLIISLILGVIAVLVAFNTVRLAIYSFREEIGVMRLVGASNWFIRGPFIIEGIFYGIVASLITVGFFYPLTKFTGPKISQFFGAVNIFEYYQANFWLIVLVLLGLGIILGSVSSFIAIRRYLKV